MVSAPQEGKVNVKMEGFSPWATGHPAKDFLLEPHCVILKCSLRERTVGEDAKIGILL